MYGHVFFLLLYLNRYLFTPCTYSNSWPISGLSAGLFVSQLQLVQVVDPQHSFEADGLESKQNSWKPVWDICLREEGKEELVGGP